MQFESKITVRFQVEGWHNWPNAPESRAYLSSTHRHLFHVEATVSVGHDDRDIEFHDFLDFCRIHLPPGQMGGQSCEMLAKGLATQIDQTYPNRKFISVTVWEDGEVGATVSSS